MTSTNEFLSGKVAGSQPRYLSEINVTPFVDVMLVLLVIFMITAPMMTTGLKVDLPKARTERLAADARPIQITIDAAGQIFIGESVIAPESFDTALAQLASDSSSPEEMRVFVSADRALDYGRLMDVVSRVANAGFTKVAFLSDARTQDSEKITP